MTLSLRATLHACADMIADALEAEARGDVDGTSIRNSRIPKAKRTRQFAPRARHAAGEIDDVTRARAKAALKKAGLG